MPVKKKDLASIDFNNDWKCYCQQSNDKTNVNDTRIDGCWSSLELPHVTDETQRSCKWWYRKQFEWTWMNPPSEKQVFLHFQPSYTLYKTSDINATIWLNGTKIFSGSLSPVKNSIKLSSKLSHRENILLICCTNSPLSFHAYLRIQGKVSYATEEMTIDENPTDTLNYTVSIDDDDRRFDVTFNPKRRSKSISTASNWSSQFMDNEDEIDEEKEDDLIVPRLAIVILIVGTRGDVQPFIALGQALRRVGHRVRLATHETFRSFVRENGLEFYPLAGDPADLMSFMVKNAGIIPSMSSIIEGDVGKKRRSLADILASTWLACTENDDETGASFTAEAIIANPPSFGHIHCAEKLMIPLHIMFTIPWSPTTQFPHPLSNIESSIIPKEKINLYSYDVIEMLTWIGMRDIVNNFRRKTLGLKELHTRQATNVLIDERVPHTYCWSPSLVAKPNDWGKHIDVSGFFFLNLSTAFTNPPGDLLEFLGINRDGQYVNRALPPPIYIGFGSITGHDSQRILGIVTDALRQTGYRALLSGLASDTDSLPRNVFKIGNVPHDWLFQYVSAVCHHGGAGTTAAGLRAGKPTIIVPFFGDQFFWGNIIEKSGAGPHSLPAKSITASQLAEAFHFVHKSRTRTAAEYIRDAILKEDGCAAAVRAFHANLPLTRMQSDLEPTFAACYRSDKYDIQISRPVAQVLVAADVLAESELRPHCTREWEFMHDSRRHFITHGLIEHSQKAFSSIFIHTVADARSATNDNNTIATGAVESAAKIVKDVGLGIGHLAIGCLSLYGETTDALDYVTTLYDPYSNANKRQRPRVTDFKSGAKAAGAAVRNGWKDGVTGVIQQPCTGYYRHGALGSVAGSLVAVVNLPVKPTVGTLASVTWLSRGTYASVRKKVGTHRNKERCISTRLFDTASSTTFNGELQQNYDDDGDEEVSPAAKIAAAKSNFHPRICQRILDEFEKIKNKREQKPVSSIKKKKIINNFWSSGNETLQPLLSNQRYNDDH